LLDPAHRGTFNLCANIVEHLEEGSGAASPLQVQQLVCRKSRGDKAFAVLYARTAAKLFVVAARIVGRKEEAEEVLQESFVAIWQRAGDYDAARGSAMRWLTTIVRHCAITFVDVPVDRTAAAPDQMLLGFPASGSTDRGAELAALQRCLGSTSSRAGLSCSHISTVSRERRSRPISLYHSERSRAGSSAASNG
jgi:Sigma-70 region 2